MRTSFISTAVLATAMLTVASCADQPTAPAATSNVDHAGTVALERGGKKSRGSITGTINYSSAAGSLVGTARLLRIDLDDAGNLVGTVQIVGTVSNYLTGVTAPVTTTVTAPLSINGVTGASAADAVAAQQIGIQQVGTCDVLDLVLGPLHLDLLGLVVDLNQVVLNVDAVAGAGNLLGNLLCAVVHLLDGPGALAAILNLLDLINNILGNLGL